MKPLLVKIFIKNNRDTENPVIREKHGRLAGITGIISNVVLFMIKLFAGIVSGSIAIIADAINNLSDSFASVITLAGFKLSGRPADEKHPYGHARYEYISGFTVSCIIIAVGVQFLVSSVQKIINPQVIEYSLLLWIILAVSIAIKLWQGLFYCKVGKMINSPSLKATAADSRNDVIITAVVLFSAVVSKLTGANIDGYIGALVALFILYSGVQLIRATLSPLLGEAPSAALVEKIRQKILSYDSVLGLHDLIVHSYGHGQRFASVHVEFSANQNIMECHDIIDNMERDFASQMQISLVVHLDPIITDDPELDELKSKVRQIAQSINPELEIHDFRMVKGAAHSNLIFDITLPCGYKESDAVLREHISKAVKEISADYFCVITIDRNYTASVPLNK